MEEAPEKTCPLCSAVLEGVLEGASAEFRCGHCGATSRYKDADLVAMFIPGYHRRLMELDALNRELLGEIEIEGMKGQARDMRYLQKKHLERQDLLAEYAFLTHFRDFVERW